MNSLNLLDFLALGILLLSAVMAAIKGIAAEVITLSSVVAGLFLAAFYYSDCADLIATLGVEPPVTEFLGFLSLFVVALIAGALLTRFVNKTLKALHLKWIDRVLGAAFGLFRGFLINVALFLALTAFAVDGAWLEASRTGPVFLAGASFLTRLVPRDLRKKFENGYRSVYEAWIEKSSEDQADPGKAHH